MDTGVRTRALAPLPAAGVGAILLAEGYASLAAEILALRRMVPFAGSAVSVTAVLLAVYLAALAGGYRRGGRLACCGDPRPRLAIRLSAAAAWAAFWLSGAGTLLAFGLPVSGMAQVAVYSVVGHCPGRLAARRVRPARPRLRSGRGPFQGLPGACSPFPPSAIGLDTEWSTDRSAVALLLAHPTGRLSQSATSSARIPPGATRLAPPP